jgi:hypothetical protein
MNTGGRPIRVGLDWFALNTNLDEDKKICMAIGKYGIVAISYIVQMWSRIYKNDGYFCDWDEAEQKKMAEKLMLDEPKCKIFIEDCLKWNLLDREFYKKFQILTSKGIQTRYFNGTTKRIREYVISDYLLIDVSGYKNIVLVNRNGFSISQTELLPETTHRERKKERKIFFSEEKNENLLIKEKFLEECEKLCPPNEKFKLKEFGEYWTAITLDGKMRFEHDKNFSIPEKLKQYKLNSEFIGNKTGNFDKLSYPGNGENLAYFNMKPASQIVLEK